MIRFSQMGHLQSGLNFSDDVLDFDTHFSVSDVNQSAIGKHYVSYPVVVHLHVGLGLGPPDAMYPGDFCAVLYRYGRQHLNPRDHECTPCGPAKSEIYGLDAQRDRQAVLVHVIEVTESGERMPLASGEWRIEQLVALDDCPLGRTGIGEAVFDHGIPSLHGLDGDYLGLPTDGKGDVAQSPLVSRGLEAVGNDLPGQVIKRCPKVVYRIADDERIVIGQGNEINDMDGRITKVVIELGFKPVRLVSVSLNLPLPLVGASITGFDVF